METRPLKLTSLVLIAFALAGCAPLPSDEVRREIKQCEDAGLIGWPVNNGRWENEVTHVDCIRLGR
jgi:hypothetical protein